MTVSMNEETSIGEQIAYARQRINAVEREAAARGEIIALVEQACAGYVIMRDALCALKNAGVDVSDVHAQIVDITFDEVRQATGHTNCDGEEDAETTDRTEPGV